MNTYAASKNSRTPSVRNNIPKHISPIPIFWLSSKAILHYCTNVTVIYYENYEICYTKYSSRTLNNSSNSFLLYNDDTRTVMVIINSRENRNINEQKCNGLTKKVRVRVVKYAITLTEV